MAKRLLIFFVFIAWTGFVLFRFNELALSFYVLYPGLVFPVFYFYNRRDRLFLFLTAGMAALVFITGFMALVWWQMLLFGAVIGALFAGLCGYRFLWRRRIRYDENLRDDMLHHLDSLKQKYHTRLESLHRLEKQVASLMQLFEIARDFSECLSFEEMTKLLREKVLPELLFKAMRFILIASDAARPFERHFLITADEVTQSDAEFSAEEAERFLKACRYKEMTKVPQVPAAKKNDTEQTEQWIFPLVIEGSVAALVIVEGASPEDLVRFEVLASHLVLQVKKIKLYETVKELSIIDGLTGVYVRRHFLERFNEELRRNIKYGHPLAVLMLDIDHFKRYNDECGHLVGDATLKEVASLLRQNLRKVDIVARYGGEEFVAVLPETSGEGAVEVAERIRSNIARHHFRVYDVDAQVTVSLGVALFPQDIPDGNKVGFYDDLAFDLVRYADKALYRAKEEGRNQVYRYQDL